MTKNQDYEKTTTIIFTFTEYKNIMPLSKILKFFIKPLIAIKMKKLAKDKEFQKAVKDMQYHSKKTEELIKE